MADRAEVRDPLPGTLRGDTLTVKPSESAYWEGLAVDIKGRPFVFSTTDFEVFWKARSTREIEFDHEGYLCESIIEALKIVFEDPDSGRRDPVHGFPGSFYDHLNYTIHADPVKRLVELCAEEMARVIRSAEAGMGKSAAPQTHTLPRADKERRRAPEGPEKLGRAHAFGNLNDAARRSRLKREAAVKEARGRTLAAFLLGIENPIERMMETLGRCAVTSHFKEPDHTAYLNTSTPPAAPRLAFAQKDVLDRLLPGLEEDVSATPDFSALPGEIDDAAIAHWFARQALARGLRPHVVSEFRRFEAGQPRSRRFGRGEKRGWVIAGTLDATREPARRPRFLVDGKLVAGLLITQEGKLVAVASGEYLTTFQLVKMANTLGIVATAKDVSSEVLKEMDTVAYRALA